MTSTVTAAAVSKNFGAYQDAAVRGPVIITKNGRPRTVLIAYEEYLRLTRRDRRVELTSTLGNDNLAAIEASDMDGSLDHLNAELLTAKILPTEPRIGWVFRYSYLWHWQFVEGRDEGDKDRPALVLAIVTHLEDGTPALRVLPITHGHRPIMRMRSEARGNQKTSGT